ncbi:MAG TPA: hypothetical protein VG694_02325 [Candidatus Paceibacterota bacterium]|jgi:hypothetical protein|nr:hypothetical protein [Candidatus Paceibacterota bacterium]
MKRKSPDRQTLTTFRSGRFWLAILFLCAFLVYFGFLQKYPSYYVNSEETSQSQKEGKTTIAAEPIPPLDKADYDQRMKALANLPPPPPPKTDPKTGQPIASTAPAKPALWPPKTVYPNAGALLPFNRIVAYYGNLYSKQMGVLGQYPEDQMLSMLEGEVSKWQAADPDTPVIPALHYIAVTAQGSAGADGKYRLRMPDDQVDEILRMADKVHGIVFLDVQVGQSTLQEELPHLEKYLKLPQVHLGIDPEFSMKNGQRPGKVIGTFDASDINYAAEFLAKIVRDNNLTPKVLVVHRFTEAMVTNYKDIKPLPEVQIVMNMDGWGGKAKKINTYRQFIYPEPVQFTGFKLFYKNDTLSEGTTLFTPAELLKLSPRPIYIQYQ